MTKKTAHKEAEAEPVATAPTQDEARAMFAERHDLAAVLTKDGWLHRDGTLRPE